MSTTPDSLDRAMIHAGYPDANGILFDQVSSIVGYDLWNWPKPWSIVKCPDSVLEFKRQFPNCMVCRADANDLDVILDAHHLGKLFRSDWRGNLCVLCRRCHEQADGKRGLAICLHARYLAEPSTVDWVKLTYLRRTFLPTPMQGRLR